MGSGIVAWTAGEVVGASMNLLLHFALHEGHSNSAMEVCLIFHTFTGWSEAVPHFIQFTIFLTEQELSLLLDIIFFIANMAN